MVGKNLGGRYQVVSRGHTEKLVKNEKRSTWTVTLRNSDGHSHSITSRRPNLWEQYPFGYELELSAGEDKQQKLAVQQVRDKTEEKSEKGLGTEGEDEEGPGKDAEEEEEKKWEH